MKSELIKYQIEYYDTAGAVRIFNCVYNEKYLPVAVERIHRK